MYVYLCIFMYVYVCLCMYLLCLYVYIAIMFQFFRLIPSYIFINAYIHKCIHSYLHIDSWIHRFIHTFIESYIHTCIHSYMCTYVRTHVLAEKKQRETSTNNKEQFETWKNEVFRSPFLILETRFKLAEFQHNFLYQVLLMFHTYSLSQKIGWVFRVSHTSERTPEHLLSEGN